MNYEQKRTYMSDSKIHILWSIPMNAWVRTLPTSYTVHISDAKLFTEEEAKRAVAHAHHEAAGRFQLPLLPVTLVDLPKTLLAYVNMKAG